MTAAFAAGQRVRVSARWPERTGPVHLRTPHYLRGVTGRVETCLGSFANPEDLAFGRPAERVPLYHVLFGGADLWPDASADDVLVEIFEHWLEPAP